MFAQKCISSEISLKYIVLGGFFKEGNFIEYSLLLLLLIS